MNPEGNVYNAMGRINRISVLCIDAYGVAVKNGFEGTVEEWLESLNGETAYDYAKEKGYTGTEEEYKKLCLDIATNTENAIEATEKANKATYDANTAANNANYATAEVLSAKNSFLESASNALEEIRNVVNDGASASPIVSSVHGEVITLDDSAERPLRGLNVYGKTTQNGTPTPEAPVALDSVGDDGSVDVTVCGKNLLKNIGTKQTASGTTFTTNDDGSITVNGTAAAQIGFAISNERLQNGTYILNGSTTNVKVFVVLRKESGTEYYNSVNGGDVRITVDDTVKTMSVVAQVTSGSIVNNEMVRPMIRAASATATEYEPYKEAQTLPISTDYGLPGIPVTSGGNYTDSNGQQWLCDEVDFEKGVYVQRIYSTVFKNATGWTVDVSSGGGKRFINSEFKSVPLKMPPDSTKKANGLCSGFPVVSGNTTWGRTMGIAVEATGWLSLYYDGIEQTIEALSSYFASHPTTFMAELAEPIETALSAQQLSAFAELHTNYPNTTIFTGEGAGMAVKYVADTKLYIDKKFAELATALVNNV